MEPPGSHVPPRQRLSAAPALRLALAAAALLLALVSRGDALVLAAVLALATWRPLPALATGTALIAAAWRWGATSLEALAGAQAVLGPAGWVGPAAAAATSWLAAGAIVLGASRPLPAARQPRPRSEQRSPLAVLASVVQDARAATRPDVGGMGARVVGTGAPKLGGAVPARGVGGMGARVVGTGAPNLDALGALVLALAAGATAATVVAGPAPGGDVWVRVAATVVAAVVALAVAVLRRRSRRVGRLLDLLAVLAGGGAVVAASADALGWSDVVEADHVVEGVGLGLAVTAIVVVAALAASTRAERAAAPIEQPPSPT